MTDIDTKEAEAALDAEKAQLEDELAKHRRKVSGGGGQGASTGFETGTADENEVADQIEELAPSVPLVEELESRYREVLAAIKRIKDGAYGVCNVCNKPIPAARLEANPAATTCIEHAE